MTPATPPAASAAAPSAPSGQPAFSHAAAPGSASEPLLFIVSAPSGSGKSTLVREILRLIPDLEFSISYTTRPPRGSEVNGREYFFISREEFEKRRRETPAFTRGEKGAMMKAAFTVYGPLLLIVVGGFALTGLLLYLFLK